MKTKTTTALFFALFAAAAVAQTAAPQPLAPASAPPAFAVDTFAVGAFIPEGADMDCGISMPGYPAESARFYESLPDRADADALGLGAFGVAPDHQWRWIFRRRPVMPRRNLPELRRPMRSGLPLAADLSIHRESHNWMLFMEGINPKEEAWIEGGVFGFPFSLATPDGIGLWQTIWRDGAKWFAKENAAPSVWFLFRDADWRDDSMYARREFAKPLNDKYKTAADIGKALNGKFSSASAASREKKTGDYPRLHAELAKFHEEKFNAALELAARTLRATTNDPPAAVFFQPKSISAFGVDLRSAAARSAIVCAPADEAGSVFAALFARAAAGPEKPLAQFGMRVPSSSAKLRDALLTQFARGYTQIWLADWRGDAKARVRFKKDDTGKTIRDPDATEAASRAAAAARPFSILNAFATPPETLGGIQQARKIIAELEPLFTPANRARGTQVALLHSRASARVAGTKSAPAPAPATAFTDNDAAEALLNLRVKTAVVFDEGEDLAALTNGQFRALVATDSSFAVSDAAASNIAAFAASGGRLILTENALIKNEFSDAPAPVTFTTNTTRLASAEFRAKLPETLAAANISAFCQCDDPATGEPLDGIEIWQAQTETGARALLIFNRRGEETNAKIEGKVLTLPPNECVVLRAE